MKAPDHDLAMHQIMPNEGHGMKRCASAGSLGQSSSGPEPAVQGRVPNSKDPWPSHNPFQVSDARGDPFQVSDASLASAIAEIERLKDLLRGERRKSSLADEI